MRTPMIEERRDVYGRLTWAHIAYQPAGRTAQELDDEFNALRGQVYRAVRATSSVDIKGGKKYSVAGHLHHRTIEHFGNQGNAQREFLKISIVAPDKHVDNWRARVSFTSKHESLTALITALTTNHAMTPALDTAAPSAQREA